MFVLPGDLAWNTVSPPPSLVSALPRLAESGASHTFIFTIALSACTYNVEARDIFNGTTHDT